MAVTGPRVGSSAKAETGLASMKAAGAKLGLSVPFKMSQMIGKSVAVKCIMGSAQKPVLNQQIYFVYASKGVLQSPRIPSTLNIGDIPESNPPLNTTYKIEDVEVISIYRSDDVAKTKNEYGFGIQTKDYKQPCNEIEVEIKGYKAKLKLVWRVGGYAKPTFYVSTRDVGNNNWQDVRDVYDFLQAGKEYEFIIKKVS
ncbi:tail fiber adhesin [Proteus phage phiP4-3]|uniref:Distal long tail fiber assembly catalyst n=1 Tax=Proteus phage phiP4-3 TaxID=2065203 RepID=A0A2I6PF74_9CAUD|nr:tail fiber adhesin [Proteus phage phiP4-3]AUM58373.1 distal long tail fiber assembly catalyst [Proteus phage phiP4-3]